MVSCSSGALSPEKAQEYGFRRQSAGTTGEEREGAALKSKYDDKAHTLAEIGELAMIDRLIGLLPASPDLVVGPGDDCAVIRGPGDAAVDWVLTSDPVIEGTHVKPGEDPSLVGHKAMGRALSDLAAMGAAPRWGLMNLVAPSSMEAEAVELLFKGALALAGQHGLIIIGGDMAEGPLLEVHMFAVGEVPRGKAVLRSSAGAGDLVYVTGALGGSAAGRHLCVTPRIKAGIFLREWASAMIDVSDGLASDLQHILSESGVGCWVSSDLIPVSPDVSDLNDDRTPLDHALYDGEDFELLFTVPSQQQTDFESQWSASMNLRVTRIGEITETGQFVLDHPSGDSEIVTARGYEHFATDSSSAQRS